MYIIFIYIIIWFIILIHITYWLVVDNHHDFEWDKIKILHFEKNEKKRKNAESIFAKNKIEFALNKRNEAYNVPSSYDVIFKKMI